MSFDDAMKKMKFDARMLEYNLKNGVISKKEYEDYLKQIPDSTEMAESIDLEKSNHRDTH